MLLSNTPTAMRDVAQQILGRAEPFLVDTERWLFMLPLRKSTIC